MNDKTPYFLPYQVKYLRDPAKFKIVEKSRRVGLTYAESYDNTKAAALGLINKVWFSSADLSASEEFIDYVGFWARFLDVAAKHVGEVVIDSENDVRVQRVTFASGAEINALSSNPTKFRSKGGRVILDEFAHHKDQAKLLAAAKPSTMWGAELRIISTHNGDDSVFNQLIAETKKPESAMSKWSHHVITLDDAIADGLVDKILGHQASIKEIEEWKNDVFSGLTKEAINEEFYCIPVSTSSNHLLSYELINAVERDEKEICFDDLNNCSGNLYAGFDVARRKDLSVIWVIEQLGEIYYTRKLIVLKNMPFREQKEILYSIISNPKLHRICIDATGLGMQIAEDAKLDFGQFKVEPVTFTNRVKEELATNTRVQVESRKVLIPRDKAIRDDLYSIRAVTTVAGNVRYEAVNNDESHADRFWSLGLALHAAKSNTGPIIIASGMRRESYDLLNRF